ncbi:hypothetical protein HERIO_449 [Hepatospora eriocheir]|uniref:Uncharacterized protein n=1 Tax=Hepatospora eriocheir TaxID=1081669 RepID=A0A1X0QD03_9MICR|nr:hypothetical protein HERIO_449 [Hepatospora eriocheir]
MKDKKKISMLVGSIILILLVLLDINMYHKTGKSLLVGASKKVSGIMFIKKNKKMEEIKKIGETVDRIERKVNIMDDKMNKHNLSHDELIKQVKKDKQTHIEIRPIKTVSKPDTKQIHISKIKLGNPLTDPTGEVIPDSLSDNQLINELLSFDDIYDNPEKHKLDNHKFEMPRRIHKNPFNAPHERHKNLFDHIKVSEPNPRINLHPFDFNQPLFGANGPNTSSKQDSVQVFKLDNLDDYKSFTDNIRKGTPEDTVFTGPVAIADFTFDRIKDITKGVPILPQIGALNHTFPKKENLNKESIISKDEVKKEKSEVKKEKNEVKKEKSEVKKEKSEVKKLKKEIKKQKKIDEKKEEKRKQDEKEEKLKKEIEKLKNEKEELSKSNQSLDKLTGTLMNEIDKTNNELKEVNRKLDIQREFKKVEEPKSLKKTEEPKSFKKTEEPKLSKKTEEPKLSKKIEEPKLSKKIEEVKKIKETKSIKFPERSSFDSISDDFNEIVTPKIKSEPKKNKEMNFKSKDKEIGIDNLFNTIFEKSINPTPTV